MGHKDHEDLNKQALEDRLSTPLPTEEITAQINFDDYQTSKLCWMCSIIFQRWPTTFPPMYPQEVSICQHHEIVLDVQRSADAGCSLCSQFRRSKPLGAWKALCTITKAWLISGCKAIPSRIVVIPSYFQHVKGHKLTLLLNRPSCHYEPMDKDLVTTVVMLKVVVSPQNRECMEPSIFIDYH